MYYILFCVASECFITSIGVLYAVLPEEKSVDLDHMLQELHQNSDKIFQLQDGECAEFPNKCVPFNLLFKLILIIFYQICNN